MKKIKSIVKTLLFSAFMTVVISTTGDTLIPNTLPDDNTVSVCSELPDLSDIISGN